jgi:hypothetical protein
MKTLPWMWATQPHTPRAVLVNCDAQPVRALGDPVISCAAGRPVAIRAFNRSAPTNRSGESPISMYGAAGVASLVNFHGARRATPRRKCTPV